MCGARFRDVDRRRCARHAGDHADGLDAQSAGRIGRRSHRHLYAGRRADAADRCGRRSASSRWRSGEGQGSCAVSLRMRRTCRAAARRRRASGPRRVVGVARACRIVCCGFAAGRPHRGAARSAGACLKREFHLRKFNPIAALSLKSRGFVLPARVQFIGMIKALLLRCSDGFRCASGSSPSSFFKRGWWRSRLHLGSGQAASFFLTARRQRLHGPDLVRLLPIGRRRRHDGRKYS